MIFIDNEGHTDPSINLALEEYCLRQLPAHHDYLLFYINEPSIIIGRNQNTLEEIHQSYIEEHGIHVIRRMSGGGAVYHDLGNLNFSFMTDYTPDKLNNFRYFVEPVIRVLNEMGVPAKMVGRNDIEIEGKKISGNAQFYSGERMFSHGTLLLNCDLSEVTNALNVKMTKIVSKGHKSARARVANIAEFMDDPPHTLEFRHMILQGLMRDEPDFQTLTLTAEDWRAVHQLRADKYATWDWNYGKSPDFDLQRTRKMDAGIVDFRLKVKKGGHIEDIKIYGDFFGKTPIRDFEDALRGVRYDKAAIQQALKDLDFNLFFGQVDRDEIMDLIYGPDEL